MVQTGEVAGDALDLVELQWFAFIRLFDHARVEAHLALVVAVRRDEKDEITRGPAVDKSLQRGQMATRHLTVSRE